MPFFWTFFGRSFDGHRTIKNDASLIRRASIFPTCGLAEEAPSRLRQARAVTVPTGGFLARKIGEFVGRRAKHMAMRQIDRESFSAGLPHVVPRELAEFGA